MSGKKKDIEFITNKILLVLVIAVIGSMILMLTSYMYRNINTFMPAYVASKVLIYVALVGAAFGIYRMVKESKEESSERRYMSGAIITVTCLLGALMFYMMAYTEYMLAAKFMYALIAAAALLYVIYTLYQHEFYVAALMGAVDSIYLWRFAAKLPDSVGAKIGTVVLLAVMAAVICVAALTAKNGTVKVGGSNYRFFDRDTEFPVFIGILALEFVLTIITLFIPAYLITFAALAIVGVVFCAAVYFTVRLM